MVSFKVNLKVQQIKHLSKTLGQHILQTVYVYFERMAVFDISDCLIFVSIQFLFGFPVTVFAMTKVLTETQCEEDKAYAGMMCVQAI